MVSDRLVAALKKRFKTPAEALQKLGLDSKLLATPANGGNSERKTMFKSTVSPTAILATGALRTYLAPRLAADAQIRVTPLLKGITQKNFASKIPDLVAALQRETRGRLAQDADISDVTEMLEAIARVGDDEPEMDTMEDDPDMNAATMGGEGEDEDAEDPAAIVARIKEMLKGKLPPEELARLDEAIGASMHREAPAEEAHDEEEDPNKEFKGGGIDEPPPFKGQPKPGGTMDKKAMDAAIAEAKADFRREQRAIDDAREFVRPWVGGLPGLAADSAEDVLRAGCRALGITGAATIKDPSALRLLIERTPRPGARHAASPERLAADAAQGARSTFATRFPGASRTQFDLA
jgi:hypothetical protein